MAESTVSPASDRVRVGLVGCGAIAHVHAAALDTLADRYQLVAVADPVPAARQAFAERFGVPAAYESQAELLAHEQVDLVILATWPFQHEDQVLEAIASGVPWVLCEKIIAPVPSSVVKMRDAASAAEATVVEGFMWRSAPRALKMAELIASGEIGTVQRMRASFTFMNSARATHWNTDPKRGGGVPFDITCYPVSALGAFLPGSPVRVSARRLVDPDGLIRELDAIIEYDDGAVALLDSCFTSGFRQTVEVAGSIGTLITENSWTSTTDGRIEWLASERFGDEERRTIEVVPEVPHVAQLAHLHRCITEGATPRISLDESLRNVTLLDAILQAAELGRTLTMGEVSWR